MTTPTWLPKAKNMKLSGLSLGFISQRLNIPESELQAHLENVSLRTTRNMQCVHPRKDTSIIDLNDYPDVVAQLDQDHPTD